VPASDLLHGSPVTLPCVSESIMERKTHSTTILNGRRMIEAGGTRCRMIYTMLADRRLADGTVHCAGSATCQIWFRLPIPDQNPNPKPRTLTLTIKLTKIQNDTGIKFNIELYLKVISLAQGKGLQKAYNRKRKSNTYGWSRLLYVLVGIVQCRRPWQTAQFTAVQCNFRYEN